MTKREIEHEIHKRKFSKGVRSYSNDKLGDLIAEIYCDGMRAGFRYAIDVLETIDVMPCGAHKDYVELYRDNIRETIELCKMYEECE